jgi:predicted metal-binding protein
VVPATDIEKILDGFGLLDYKWIDPTDIRVSEWVRMKCRYGCALYSNRACCPPNGPTVIESRRFFREYSKAILMHFNNRIVEKVETTNNVYLNKWYRDVSNSIVSAEREVFFRGYYKVFSFVIGPCTHCAKCNKTKEACIDQLKARPTPESFGVDVFGLARRYGFKVETLSDYNQEINSFGLLMVE